MFGAVVATYFGVLLTKSRIKVRFSEVGQQLYPPAFHDVLTVMDHAVEVVEVGLPGVAVALPFH